MTRSRAGSALFASTVALMATTALSTAPALAAPAPTPATPLVDVPVAGSVVGVARRIVVEGNERIEPATVISYMPVAAGDTVDDARIDLALKTLFRTELFADVSIDLQPDGTLVVRVVENPIINQVVFEGNKALNDEKLRNEVNIHPRSVFTRASVQADVQRIVELYRRSGRISAQVAPEMVELPQRRVDLIFRIVEGPKTGIERINFLGNEAFSDNDLRDVMLTTDSRWFKFFTSNDNYDPDRIEYDREQLRKFYTNRGYYDFRVVSSIAELKPDQRRFSLTFTVDEGPRYRFGKMTVTTGDVRRLNGDVLRQLLPIQEGQIFQSDRIERAVDTLTFAAGAAGFAFVDIRPRYVANRETNTIDVNFEVREGPRVYIERIDVVGNTRTLDQVIRRELQVAEGDAYNRVLSDRSVTELKRLNFFKTVEIEQIPGAAPDRNTLRVRVEEQPTGELSFGAGYSSVDKLLIDLGISEHNFRGRGQDVRLRVSAGSRRRQIDAAFTEPRFLGRDLRGGVNLYSYTYDFSEQTGFETKSIGGGVSLMFPLNTYTYFRPEYLLHSDKVVVNQIACQLGQISVTICDQTGNSLTSELGYTLLLDRRNDPIRPTRGYYANFQQKLAGLGGDVKYVRSTVDGAWYRGLPKGLIFQANLSAGYVMPWGGDEVRINDRFFIGGTTFRGFETAGIGPRDTTYSESLGGKLQAVGSFELHMPGLIPEQYGIKTALFTEFGTLGLVDKSVKALPNVVDDLALRATAGISVFWNSPMGPIRLDFSKILKKEPYDRTEGFRFSTSTQF